MKKNVNKDIRKDNRKIKSKKNTVRKLIVSFVAVALLFAIGIYAEREFVNSDIDTEVVVSKADIAKDTYITVDNIADYFELKHVRNSNLPDNAVIRAEDIVDKYITREYTKNEVLSMNFVNDFNDEYEKSIDNKVYVSASVGALESAVSGQIKEGDRVDLIVFGSDPITKEIYILRKYKNLRVIEAFSQDGTSNEEQTTVLFTFLIDAKDEDRLSLDLRSSGIRITKTSNKGGSYEVIDY